MTKMIFVNLPVADVARATAFYEAIGMVKNDAFSNESASAMMWSETISFMLLSHDFFRTFTPKAIPDARTTALALICLSADSRAEVDAMLARAASAGGKIDPISPQEVNDFMYGRSFEDLDGHGIELMWMDPAAAANGPGSSITEAA